MITVVCLSPSLDRTITLPRLEVGGTNRVQDTRTSAGGKGVNVALALAGMGERVRLAVFRHAQGAAPLFEALSAARVECLPVDVPGALRVNLKLLDASSAIVTEVNASAGPVPSKAVGEMEEAIAASARESRWLVLTGSLPKGYPQDAYARIIRRAREEAPGCRIALDAEGEPLRLGAQAGPDLIKPNRRELEMLSGRALQDGEAVIAAAREAALAGAGAVLVSMDVEGSALVTGDRVLRAEAVPVPVATTVGAGDALLSGFVHAADRGERCALAYAVAAATARVAGQDGEAEGFLPRVIIE